MRAALIAGIFALGVIACAWQASAGSFRIETKIYSSSQKEPVSENLTLFDGSAVYDFSLVGSKEIVVLDTQRQRFELLDPTRQLKTEFDCKELLQFSAELQQIAARGDAPLPNFAAHPKFHENFDRPSGLLTLTSGVIDYRVETVKPPQVSHAEQYGLFADWYTRLNATQPGALPPFHRLHLNDVLVKHGVVPTKVERTLFNGAQRTQSVWSEHRVSWQLTGRDRQQIDTAQRLQVHLKGVKFGEYHVVATPK